MAHGESRGERASRIDFLSPGRGDIITMGRVGSLCRPDQIGAHALICAPQSHGFRRGPHYCAANAASDHAEAFKLTLMGLARPTATQGRPKGRPYNAKVSYLRRRSPQQIGRGGWGGWGASYQCTSKKTHLKKDS